MQAMQLLPNMYDIVEGTMGMEAFTLLLEHLFCMNVGVFAFSYERDLRVRLYEEGQMQ